MELYTFYKEMPYFRHFCDYARQFPHVLPHTFASALEGYYQALGDQFFRLVRKIPDPELPFYNNAYNFARYVKAEIYPIIGRPIDMTDPEVARKIPGEKVLDWQKALQQFKSLFGTMEISMVMNFVADAGDRIHSLLTEFVVESPPRTHLKDILPYSNISEKCTQYMKRSTLTDLSQIPHITKELKKATLKVPGIPFSRLANLEKTVTYSEPLQKPSIKT